MSTKTTFKRVALVAVAALGLGMVSVVPSQAVNPTAISVGTIPAFTPGVTSTIPVTFALPAATTSSDSITVVARVVSAPATSFSTAKAAVSGTAAITSTAATANTFTWSKPVAGISGAGGQLGTEIYNGTSENWTAGQTYTLTSTDLLGQVTLNLGFTPDVAGSYTIMFAIGNETILQTPTQIAAATTATLAGQVSTTATLTTVGSPTTATLTPHNAVAATTVASGGSLLKVTLGSTLLGAGQSITLTASATTVSFSDSVLTNGDFTAGTAYVNVYNTAEGTPTITATQSGLLTGFTPVSTSIEFKAATSTSTAVIGVATAQTSYVIGTASSPNDVVVTASTTRTTQTICVTDETAAASADVVNYVKFTDTSGKLTGKAGSVFAVPVTVPTSTTAASRKGCVTVSGTLLNSQSFTANILSTNATDQMLVTGATRTASTITVLPTTNLLAAEKSTNVFTATVRDQFGSVLAGRTINIRLTGRNAAVVADAISDASGLVSYSLVDAGTVGTSDTVTFVDSAVSTATASATVTYGAIAVDTMTLTGGNTTAGVTSTTKTVRDIAAGTAGPTGAVYTITATIKSASGALMAGVPVSWTVAGTGAAIRSTGLTSYSSAAGTASTTVYGWIAGDYTVTATAAGKTATAQITFGQLTAAEARTVTASVSGPVVTAKVVDRFGNPVSGAPIVATRVSGTGFFGTGSTTATGTTNALGLADFAITGGDAVVRVATSAPGVVPADQTCAAAGKVDCPEIAADAVSFTATTVGTATTGETGVGATFAPAGTNSATADVVGAASALEGTVAAAADAAAEATDAANAATDAANAAAEAADAATAAAQDAADAVAALSTQVTELVSALRKQITSLTNLVIKIQRKVRA
jgi:trimeric autotransporter adhesin